MRQFSVFSKVGALVILAANPGFATLVTYLGNAYSPGTSPQRATWAAQLPSLTYDNVDLSTECVSPCAYSYNNGPQSLTNVSGQTISGIQFVASNTGSGTNQLYVRSTGTTRNNGSGGYPNYTSLVNGSFNQMAYVISTVQQVTGTASITLTLPTGTRSVGFDFANINSASSNISITANTASTSSNVTPTNRYDVGAGSPNYLTTGPGFYGVVSNDTDGDITTITITTNGSTSQWILNIANIRFGTLAAEAAVPEPSPQLMLGAALISISLLLRHRSKSQRGGNA